MNIHQFSMTTFFTSCARRLVAIRFINNAATPVTEFARFVGYGAGGFRRLYTLDTLLARLPINGAIGLLHRSLEESLGL